MNLWATLSAAKRSNQEKSCMLTRGIVGARKLDGSLWAATTGRRREGDGKAGAQQARGVE